MTAAIVDTHSHIQVDRFAEDREDVIARALEAGLSRIVVCGDDVPSSHAALALADAHECVLPTAGIHPHEAESADDTALDAIRAAAWDPRCVAVGEIGLDFYRDHSSPEAQHRALEDQLAIAVETSQPVVIHSRGAEDAAVEPLKRYAAKSPLPAWGRPAGMMHCFGGTLEQARVFVELGFVVSPRVYHHLSEERRAAAHRRRTAAFVTGRGDGQPVSSAAADAREAKRAGECKRGGCSAGRSPQHGV
ncbi:MAG: TatD family hydrolase [Dehalococcoidia bacterium]|nr:TatD family hydrolase [Dehalococcoidia bacterium]